MHRVPQLWQHWPVSLRWAVSISIGLHLLVIFPLAFWLYTPIAMPQAPLSAVLRGPGESTQTAHEDSRHIAPLSAGETRKPTPKNPRVPLIQTQHAERAADTVPPLRPTPVGVAQGDPAAAPNVSAKAGSIGGAPELARDGADADALAEYRIALARAAKNAWRKPNVRHSDKKVCQVDVLLTKTGTKPRVVLAKSSGVAVLDEAVLAAFELAVSRASIPPELLGRDRRIPLQMTISVEDF